MISKPNTLLVLLITLFLMQGCARKPEPVPELTAEQIRMQNQMKALAGEMKKLRAAQTEITTLKTTIAAMDTQLVQYREEAAQRQAEQEQAQPRISPTDPDIINLKGNILVLTREIDSLKQGMKILQVRNDSLRQDVARREQAVPAGKLASETVKTERVSPVAADEMPAEDIPPSQPRTMTKHLPTVVTVAEPTPAVGYTLKAEYSQAYQQALNAYFAKDFSKAIEEFKILIQREPLGSYSDNAQYWIGECYYSMEDYGTAIQEFQRVFQFPENNKSDHALFKIAISYEKLGDNQRARETMNRFILDFPESDLIEEAHNFLSAGR